jgi:hypothetical protein
MLPERLFGGSTEQDTVKCAHIIKEANFTLQHVMKSTEEK